jgi:hypothetical protein
MAQEEREEIVAQSHEAARLLKVARLGYDPEALYIKSIFGSFDGGLFAGTNPYGRPQT